MIEHFTGVARLDLMRADELYDELGSQLKEVVMKHLKSKSSFSRFDGVDVCGEIFQAVYDHIYYYLGDGEESGDFFDGCKVYKNYLDSCFDCDDRDATFKLAQLARKKGACPSAVHFISNYSN